MEEYLYPLTNFVKPFISDVWQSSEYAFGLKYAKILDSQYANVTQRSKYGRICLDSVLNISRVLSVLGFWIWQGFEYARVTQGLNMSWYGSM